MSGYAKGGNDTLIGGGDGSALFGDAGGNMSDHALGGNDILMSSGGQITIGFGAMFGDAGGQMSGYSQGGNDVLTYTGPDSFDGMYGDAKTMVDHAHGGNDVLTLGGTTGFMSLYGDAYSMSDHAVGGNDTLIGGLTGNDTLIGDAFSMQGKAVAGNDTLISRGANDQMWGDGVVVATTVIRGENTFVFAPMNGQDTINDFNPGHDHIDLTADAAIGVHQFSDLHIDTVGNNSVIAFDPHDQITVVGNTHLTAHDFLLA